MLCISACDASSNALLLDIIDEASTTKIKSANDLLSRFGFPDRTNELLMSAKELIERGMSPLFDRPMAMHLVQVLPETHRADEASSKLREVSLAYFFLF